jgi:uncharacterized membrane protein YraQ (UPF0718 family)
MHGVGADLSDNGQRQRKRTVPFVPCLLVASVGLLWLLGLACPGFEFGQRTAKNFAGFLVEMVSVLPAAFLLIGLFNAWVPRRAIERHLGQGAGMKAVVWVIILATIQVGPLYAAFPFAIALWRKGCTPRNVFIYLGSFSALKIPMLTFEMTFLGWRFSVARVLITLPVFILLGALMARFLPEGFKTPKTGL